MSTRNPVYRETAAIAIGEVLCVGLMLGIYALALERITGLRVKEKRLCLLASGEEIVL